MLGWGPAPLGWRVQEHEEGPPDVSNDVWHLRSVDWLSALPEKALERLRAMSAYRDYGAGETIFEPEADPHSVYLLERGLVRIYRLSSDGAETTFGYVAAGEVFGELTAFGAYPRESFAMAVRASRAWRIEAVPFRKLLSEQPGLAIEVGRQMGSRMKQIESRVEDLVFRDVRSRLAHILLELAASLGERHDGRVVIAADLTQAEIATLIGSTRQTVNATLRELEARGLVGRDGRRLALLDMEALEGISAAPTSA